MDKIVLSSAEINVINQHLNGLFEVWNATDAQQENLSKVIDKAEALMSELNAYDELYEYEDMSLIEWFFDKYKAQEGIR